MFPKSYNLSSFVLLRVKQAVKFCVVTFALWLLGLLLFLSEIPDTHQLPQNKPDALVILTGGSTRITEGFKLYNQLHPKKILISGVGKGLSKQEILKILPENERRNVQIDDLVLGEIADSTFTNAIETEIFLNINNFSSCVVATSNYHIPRTRFIFDSIIQDRKIDYYAIFNESFRKSGDFVSFSSFFLIISEYNKLIAAIIMVYFQKSELMWDSTVVSIANFIKARI